MNDYDKIAGDINMDPLVQLLVEDLLKLWEGIEMQTAGCGDQLIRAAVLLHTHDTPDNNLISQTITPQLLLFFLRTHKLV